VRRLPALAFAALVVATVGAFFVTQHLKSSTPLYAGFPRPKPQWINPRSGGSCDGISHRSTQISFYLLHRADDVDVYIVNNAGTIVRTIASGRHMRIRVRHPDGELNGTAVPTAVRWRRTASITSVSRCASRAAPCSWRSQ
jgi:hypothetical protein